MSTLSDSGFEEDLQCPSPDAQSDDQHDCLTAQRAAEPRFLAMDCLARQPQVTAEARSTLVSWLTAVHKHFDLSFESCCLTVNIIDRFLLTTMVAADCFQLLGVTALLIASKHVDVCSPPIKQLLSLCCNAYSRGQLCNLECIVLLKLNFRLAAPTLAFFLDYSMSRELNRLGIDISHCGNQTCGAPEAVLSYLRWYRSFAQRVCELSLADYAFNKYRPSVIAQSAVGLTKEILQVHLKQSPLRPALDTLFTEEEESLSTESPAVLRQCTEELKVLLSLNHTSLRDLITL